MSKILYAEASSRFQKTNDPFIDISKNALRNYKITKLLQMIIYQIDILRDISTSL